MIKRIRRLWANNKMSIKYLIGHEMIYYSAIIFFIVIGLICTLLIIYLDNNDPEFSWHDILVEAHGLIFDLLIFGFIWTVFEFYKSKKEKIISKKDEIDDLINLKTDEARVRIISNINSLYFLGIRKFFISGAFLKGGSLQELDLTDSKMVFIDFEDGSFIRSNLEKVDLRSSNLKSVYFTSANLENTKLSNSNLRKAKFTDTNLASSDLSNCDLREAEFAVSYYENANFTGAKLTNALVDKKDWFLHLQNQNVIGIEELIEKYYISENPIEKMEGITTYVIKKRKKNPS